MKKLIITLSLTLILFQNNGFSQSNTVDLYDSYKSLSGGIAFSSYSTLDINSFTLYGSGTTPIGNSNFLADFGVEHEWLSGTGVVLSSFNFGLGYAIDLGNVHIIPDFSFGYVREHDWTYLYDDDTFTNMGLAAKIKVTDGAILRLGISSTSIRDNRNTFFGVGASFKVSPIGYFNLGYSGKSGVSNFTASFTTCY